MRNRCIAQVDDVSFWRLITNGRDMRRDDDYLRKLLMELEDHRWWAFPNQLAGGDDAEAEKRYYHMLLLVDGGLMAPVDDKGVSLRITNAGHDFLAMTRDSEKWEAVKGAAHKLGGASVQMLYRIAESYARQKLVDIGIPLA